MFATSVLLPGGAHRMTEVAVVAVAGVTAAGA
jgi:hypothetical protein